MTLLHLYKWRREVIAARSSPMPDSGLAAQCDNMSWCQRLVWGLGFGSLCAVLGIVLLVVAIAAFANNGSDNIAPGMGWLGAAIVFGGSGVLLVYLWWQRRNGELYQGKAVLTDAQGRIWDYNKEQWAMPPPKPRPGPTPTQQCAQPRPPTQPYAPVPRQPQPQPQPHPPDYYHRPPPLQPPPPPPQRSLYYGT